MAPFEALLGRDFTLNKLPRLRRLALAGLLLTGSGLVGCSPLRLLKPGQRLLDDVEIRGTEKADPERLVALVQQQPNSTFPLPKVTIYQFGRSFYNPERITKKLADTKTDYARQITEAGTDSAQVGRLLRKREQKERRYQLALDKGNAVMRLGEPPVVYDSSLTAASVLQLGVYLKSKGFFRNSVTVSDTVPTRRFAPLRLLTLRSPYYTDSQRVTVTYDIKEGPAFHYSRLDDEVADSAVAQRVRAARPQSQLRVGDQYDEEVIGAERVRLETLLKNQGYYDFRQQYITFEADTSFRPTTVRLRTLVAAPAQGEHRLYTLRHVDFISDAGIVRFGRTRDTLVRDSVNYLAYRHRISPRALDRKLALRPNEPYSLTSTQRTQRQLASLDMFRFTTISYRRVRGSEAPADSARGLLDATVSAAPAKRFQETLEFGGTYVAQEVGPFGNVRLKIRNVFGGAEILEFGVRAGFEGQYIIRTDTSDVNRSLPHELTTQLGANVNLVLPRFLVPWRMSPRLSEYNPRTRINASYTYVDRPDYTRTNAEGTLDYIWQRSAFHQYVLTPVDLSIIRTSKINEQFQKFLQDLLIQQGSPLFRSFDNLFIPSINATSLYNSNDFNETRDARYLRLFAEVGGLGRSLVQKQPLLTDTRDLRKSDLKIYDFTKFTADYRRYYKLTSNSYFVYRLAGGAVAALTPTTLITVARDGSPLTSTSYLIPYDKYMFSGGSSSVRAWKPRRLGPGSSTQYKFDPKNPSQLLLNSQNQPIRDYNLEQPGELLLEGNVEYRFPLYNFIKGAVFTDFGNVWTIRPDPRPGAQFQFNKFYQQFAVGSGFGFRFDLSFLIMRLDIATKVYDPTAPGNKWAIRKFSFREDQTAFNLGIGYPF